MHSSLLQEMWKAMGAEEERTRIILWLCRAAKLCLEEADEKAKATGHLFLVIAKVLVEESGKDGGPTGNSVQNGSIS